LFFIETKISEEINLFKNNLHENGKFEEWRCI